MEASNRSRASEAPLEARERTRRDHHGSSHLRRPSAKDLNADITSSSGGDQTSGRTRIANAKLCRKLLGANSSSCRPNRGRINLLGVIAGGLDWAARCFVVLCVAHPIEAAATVVGVATISGLFLWAGVVACGTVAGCFVGAPTFAAGLVGVGFTGYLIYRFATEDREFRVPHAPEG
jgi:hypothetical protein